jgi:hypothetical protein
MVNLPLPKVLSLTAKIRVKMSVPNLTRARQKTPPIPSAFTRRLGLGFGTVSQVLAGKRTLAPKPVNKVLDRLRIGPANRARILKVPKQKLSFEHTQLQADEYFILSEWHYLAILNHYLASLPNKHFLHDSMSIMPTLGMHF